MFGLGVLRSVPDADALDGREHFAAVELVVSVAMLV